MPRNPADDPGGLTRHFPSPHDTTPAQPPPLGTGVPRGRLCRPGGHSEGPNTRSHPELGRENPQRQWYCTSRCGRVGRRQARNPSLLSLLSLAICARQRRRYSRFKSVRDRTQSCRALVAHDKQWQYYRCRSVEHDPHAGSPVQQAFQVKANELIVAARTQQSRESRRCGRVLRFELAESIEVGRVAGAL